MTQPTATHRAPAWVVPTVVGVIAAALIAYIMWGSGLRSRDDVVIASDATAVTADAQPTPADSPQNMAPTGVDEPGQADVTAAERRDPDDLLAVGPVDAPVVLVVFSDYQCSFCAKWSEETLPAMMEFVADGDLRIEWRDVNIYGSDSERAARAAYAAARQDHLWEYHHELFPDGKHRSSGGLSDEALVQIAERLSLDISQFRADMTDQETLDAVLRNQQLGIDLGAFSTPSFVMGGQPIVGALPTDVFVEAFEQVLANSTA